ncbi:hypothetical protein A3A46_00170 [Candidatus Roizmanbacteria bacterium RIFCSPLOWO2_01_FULL_37_13]|uniref:Bacterial spore germination immunoglobulin-like domain-containing protein n=1 Tax=Candidatus Roizmanbacteria bacterium RIFCSPHIGHO2_02_FULL_38_11 TaxID=1802039 RepID=A0A1F7H4K0_9BACT|nr:MAG: hypothetical protein A3C25_02805 [Candidatus Roizmanbacteria bacterium RIFCSPHIGHO2_02_FULL_38_11]OGK34323.1 MAG: hypothetical protein A3F58_01695 [Candidatus Roizmanbacteria bacterium RIFCSPHIGHO2_12_FULL_37_9b]OGK42312.1 MAG: hypothetical protein A3A46_00170 [Candidatus Roizmanbacteria bacterium RIFCSPLOWO2_01_FULL_37_13]
MKKETVIAIFFGIVFGASVALVLLAKNKEFQLAKTKTIAPTEKIKKLSKKVVVNLKSLEILEPQDGSIFNAETVKIKGKADTDALIIIQSPIKDLVFNNEQEQFSVIFPLALGENVIRITSHPKDTSVRPQEKELHIYNLDEQL